jgi:hypothetical protein
MSTEITVVVGADSNLRRDAATRTARRRDRLDSEALRDQVKAKAQEEDKSKGFNNKKDEYDPSRDPAAHARKKSDVSVGGFTTCNIRQLYYKERKTELTTEIGSVAYNYSGGKFMDIFIKAIKPDGNYGNEVEINITRNRLDPMFYVPQSELDVTLSDKLGLFIAYPVAGRYLTWRDAPYRSNYRAGLLYSLAYQDGATPNPYRYFGWYPYFGPNQSDDVGRPNKFIKLEDGTWRAYRGSSDNVYDNIPDQYLTDASGTFDHYIALGEFFSNGSANYYRYNYNRYMSCGDEDDIQNALGRPGYGDPGYQIYMLPLNENHSYVAIVYTDVEISFRGFAHYYGTMESRVDVEGEHPDADLFSGFYAGLGGTRHLEPPEYFYPPCFEINSSQTQLTDQVFKKIQQVKIVQLKDGVATLIPDDQIPASLRQSLGVVMPLNPETKAPIDFYDTYFMGSGRDYRWLWSYDLDLGAMTYSITATDDNQVYKEPVIDWYAYRNLDFHGINSQGRNGSEYRDDKARDRSLAKGYGFGFLETSNHFDSIYVENYGQPFKAESTYLANDPIFTPAIYSYLGLVAKPSINYEVAESGLLGIKPERFVSIDFETKQVSSVQLPDSLSSIDVLNPIDSSLVSKPQEIPIFRRATHYAWNWDNPEFCWQRLIDMGFTAAMIGPKPENPTDE